MTIPDPIRLDPQHPDIASQLAVVPPGAGIYLLSLSGAAPHLSACGYLRARMQRILLRASALRNGISRIECWSTGSKLESWILLYSLARRLYPEDYARKLRLRAPWFVGLALSDRFPRVFVTSRMPDRPDPLYGPFATRDAAQAYAEAVSGLFQIRRCSDALTPSPDHPGCIYGEMSQCLRPCQVAVSDEEYATETARVSEFLLSNGAATRTSLTIARERASEQMDFETAAQVHKRLERLVAASALREEVTGDVYSFSGVALTRSACGGMRLWPMYNGIWQDSLDVPIEEDPSQAKSLDAAVRERLLPAFSGPTANSPDRASHLALFLRWYRSSWRDGEWFPRLAGGGVNYRRLVREISKLARY